MYSIFNDKHFGQWLALNMPFRDLDAFLLPSILAKVPDKYVLHACALELAPPHRPPAKFLAWFKPNSKKLYQVCSVCPCLQRRGVLSSETLAQAVQLISRCFFCRSFWPALVSCFVASQTSVGSGRLPACRMLASIRACTSMTHNLC